MTEQGTQFSSDTARRLRSKTFFQWQRNLPKARQCPSILLLDMLALFVRGGTPVPPPPPTSSQVQAKAMSLGLEAAASGIAQACPGWSLHIP